MHRREARQRRQFQPRREIPIGGSDPPSLGFLVGTISVANGGAHRNSFFLQAHGEIWPPQREHGHGSAQGVGSAVHHEEGTCGAAPVPVAGKRGVPGPSRGRVPSQTSTPRTSKISLSAPPDTRSGNSERVWSQMSPSQ